MSYDVLILNSNPWFSAVSDYSLQLALYAKKQSRSVLYCSQVGFTHMDKKCVEERIDFKNIPIHVSTPINIIFSLFILTIIFIQNRHTLKDIIVFEGREHTLLCITKVLFPFWWKNKKIIRVRGQAQIVKNHFFSRLIYNYLTSNVVFAAKIVEERVKFKLKSELVKIVYYGKHYFIPNENLIHYSFSNNHAPIVFDRLTFFILGRFDPVKGHDFFLSSYLKADLKIQSQVIFVGTKENTSAEDLYEKYKNTVNYREKVEDSIFLLEKENKKIIMIQKKIQNVFLLAKNANFAVIPSLDSEVICRVAVEFLQAGVPILYSNVGALPEVLRELNEFKFSSQNENELIKKIQYAENIYQDSEVYSSYRKKSFNLWKDFYSDSIYKDILS